MASFCKFGRNLQDWPTKHKILLDFKFVDLATEARPRNAGHTVPQFMSAWLT